MIRSSGRRLVPAALLVAVPFSAPASAQSVEEFYKGKTITLAIGFDTGGGYDIYGRLLSRHLSKHIPGHPAIIVQNMPGAGSLRAAQYLYLGRAQGRHRARHLRAADGHRAAAQAPSAQFDGTKFNWIGSITNEVSTCVAWHTVAGEDLGRHAGEADHARRRRPGRRSRCVRAPLQATCSTPRSSWSAAITAPRRSSWRWSAARSTGSAAIRGAPSRASISLGSRRRRSTSWCRPALQEGRRDRRRAARARSGENRGAAPDPQAHPHQPGDRASVRGAAGRASRPRRCAARGLRRHHEGPEFLAEAKKLNLDVNPLAARPSQACWRALRDAQEPCSKRPRKPFPK